MADKDNNIGSQIGNYHLIAEIGSGGYGRVYRGQHIYLTNRTVAIKLLHTHLDSSEERDQALQEARVLEKLKHPHILHIFDVGIDDGFPYLIAEYAPNGSLRQRIKQYTPGPLPLDEVLSILFQIGQALHYAHQQSIIHRDLKPENILFNSNNEALLADFGIATTLAATSVKAVTILGTPLYMAPEQFQGIISKESDQYSLGCITYELVTGKPPFSSADFFSMGFKHLMENPVPPIHLNPGLPMHMNQAIIRAMAKQRSDRHSDIQAFIKAMRTPVFSQQYTQTYESKAYTTITRLQQQPTLNDPATSKMSKELTQTGFSGTTRQGERQGLDESEKDQNPFSSTPHNLGPMTPLPLPIQTPSYVPNPVTPLPAQIPVTPYEFEKSKENAWSTASPLQAIPEEGVLEFISTSQQSTGQVGLFNTHDHNLHSNVISTDQNANTKLAELWERPAEVVPLASSKPGPKRGRVGTKRAWLIIAVACIVLVASILSIGLGIALPPISSNNNPVNAHTQQTIGAPTNATQAPTSSITNAKTPSVVPGKSLTPTITHASTAVPTPTTPTAGSTVTVTPTPIIPDNLTVPFTSNGVPTTHSYQGSVTITVSGTGQASQTQYSDAFYVFTDNSGAPITPYHPVRNCWDLYINGQPADHYTALPAYNGGHSYTFTINAPGGILTFDECDGMRSDNTGYYNITVKQN